MNDLTARRLLRSCYGLTIFLSAFLLFQVQPLIGKCILPWFGGAPAVWTTCMLFFQAILFLGYAYAHGVSSRLSPRHQGYLHLLVLLAAVVTLPITPSAGWKPSPDDSPVVRILGLLTASVGLPYFVLSSTGPLLQSWFSRTHAGESPYRLYSLSNIGSLLALISYPFVIEPSMSTATQSVAWSVGFSLFAILCAATGVLAWQLSPVAVPASERTVDLAAAGATVPTSTARWGWFVLAATPSVLLLATTNQVCLDVAVIPFLWIVPLVLYLLSFILCFDSDRWYARRPYAWGALVGMALVCWMVRQGAGAGLAAQSAVYFGGLFACCMVCHGELSRMRPSPQFLTGYYLTISAGGAVGGLFVGLVAPRIFGGYFELQLGIAVCLVICSSLLRNWDWQRPNFLPRGAVSVGITAVVLVFAAAFWQARTQAQADLPTIRNFYGILTTTNRSTPLGDERVMLHGRIIHGRQFLSPDRLKQPTTYYTESSGIGLALSRHRGDEPRHVGVIGLGAGTLAVYARPNDRFRYYEIDADVIRMAEDCFTFLRDSAGERTTVTGDARLSLEYETDQQFDVLALDAFSGDAIPVHLLTREAMSTYLRHLHPEGVLAFHISNLHFDLRPVIAGLVDSTDLESLVVTSLADPARGAEPARWILASRSRPALDAITRDVPAQPLADDKVRWTDDRSNLLEIMRFR